MNIYSRKVIILSAALLTGASSLLSLPAVAAETVSLSSLDLSRMIGGFNIVNPDMSASGNPLTLGGKKYDKGIGTHSTGMFRIDLKGAAESFSAVVGVDEKVKPYGSVEFIVIGDGKELWRSGVLKSTDQPKTANVDIKGVKILSLAVTDGGDGANSDHADWADAKLTYNGVKPEAVDPKMAGEKELVFVSLMDLSKLTCDRSQDFHVDKSFGRKELTLGGKKFTNGIGTRSNTVIPLDLKGAAESFTATVGVDEGVKPYGSVEFIVIGDGKELWRSGVLKSTDQPKTANVDVKGVNTLLLMTTDGGDDGNSDHADWADAKLIVSGKMPTYSAAPVPVATPATAPASKTPAPAVASAPAGTRTFNTLPVNKYTDPENRMYQYFLPEDPAKPNDQWGAYLWLPSGCKRVDGLILAPRNMDELPFLQHPETRRMCKELNLGILLLHMSMKSPFFAGANPDYKPDNGFKILNYKAGGGEALQKIFDQMADLSGYAEIKNAPLISMGHSMALNWPAHVAYWNPGRSICAIPLKSGFGNAPNSDPGGGVSNRLNGAPGLIVTDQYSGNWADGDSNSWKDKMEDGVKARRREGSPNGNPVSLLFIFGGGHCEMPEPMMKIMMQYIRKACARRLPAAPADGPVKLKEIDLKDGWLVDKRLYLPAAQCNPTASWANYKGDRAQAFWYFDEEMARACESFVRNSYENKKPQCVSFIDNSTDKPTATIVQSDWVKISLPSLADDQTFKLKAVFLTDNPRPNLFNGLPKLGNSGTPMKYSVVLGAAEQIGEDTFRVVTNRFSLDVGSQYVLCHIQAENYGNQEYQPSYRMTTINMPGTSGTPQKLEFPPIENITAGTKTIKLKASTDSGLPIGYFVQYGPAVVEGDSLRITELPARCKFPITVRVAAYQWGSYGPKPVRGTGPIFQNFSITQAGAPTGK